MTSIFIASKFTELEPLTLDLMQRKASHGKIAAEAILARELDIMNTLKFRIAIPTLKDCVDNFLTACESDSVKAVRARVDAECERFMANALLNFRFSFDMRPSQVALAVIRKALAAVEAETGSHILTSALVCKLEEHQVYSKGRMNGISKRLQ